MPIPMPPLYKPIRFYNTHYTFFLILLSFIWRLLKRWTMKSKFFMQYFNKWKKVVTYVKLYTACEYSIQWASLHEKSSIVPSDVPKGHMVVYVGENHKRFVIKITLLTHPLFKALLDQAREEYGFTASSKLCIPCDEHHFLSVLCCASSTQHERMCFCLWEIILLLETFVETVISVLARKLCDVQYVASRLRHECPLVYWCKFIHEHWGFHAVMFLWFLQDVKFEPFSKCHNLLKIVWPNPQCMEELE